MSDAHPGPNRAREQSLETWAVGDRVRVHVPTGIGSDYRTGEIVPYPRGIGATVDDDGRTCPCVRLDGSGVVVTPSPTQLRAPTEGDA